MNFLMLRLMRQNFELNGVYMEQQTALLESLIKRPLHKNRRSAIDYYGEDYMDKLLKVTGGRVLHDYIAPRFTLAKRHRR